MIILVIAALVVGPQRLPVYAQKLAQFVKSLRRMAEGAKNQLSEEMGENFNDVDWKQLDPRQYDPRRIIRDALREEGAKLAGTTNSATKLNTAKPTKVKPLADGESAPFDSEAT